MSSSMDISDRLSELFKLASDELFRPDTIQKTWIPLADSQVNLLEKNGNRSSDWSKVRISPETELFSVSNCRFEGNVRLALLSLKNGNTILIPQLRGSMLQDVEIQPGCRILSVDLLQNLRIHEGVTIENCGRVVYSPGSMCGLGADLELGVETGERNVRSFPFLSTDLAGELSGGDRQRENLAEYHLHLDGFLKKQRSRMVGIIERGSRILDTPVVENCFIGVNVSIANACAVRNSTLLGGENEASTVSDGALVRDSIIKWNAVVDSMAIVERSIVGEASTVEKHGKLTASFLGPNSVLAEGEITASLAGPFTAAHHQSLLIAARWPEGKGNIGYGANVGSNHTSRLPDQEIRPGEGMFFGLSCSIKFPSDFSRAPFSIIATGVTTLPQRVEFPFSLICEPFTRVDGIPPAFNQIIPAWVLSDNLFAVFRNEEKYSSRNRAKHWDGSTEVFRPDIIDMLIDAEKRLSGMDGGELYTEKDIPGLGKNFLTEEHRKKALETYRFHIKYYALSGLRNDSDPELITVFKRDILEREFPEKTVDEMLDILANMRKKVEEIVHLSKSKDFLRGSRIITDYEVVRNQDID